MISKVLMVGIGSIGRRHLRLLREALPSADIRALRHSGCQEPIAYANGCFDCIQSALVFSPQIAIISSPAPFHLGVAQVLAEGGTHLLVEKPVSHTLSGVADLVSLCSARGLVFQVGYNLRFLETLQLFRKVIADGQIGKVCVVRCEIGQYLPSWRPGTDYRTAVSAQAALGGGVLLELSHEIDMLRWVFGEAEWVSAWTGRQSMLDIDVEDCAMLQIGFSSGAVAQLGMDFLRRDTTRTCTAIGSDGTLLWDAVAGKVNQYDPVTGIWTELSSTPLERDTSYRAQIAAFIAAVNGQSEDIAASGHDGLAAMCLIDAARRSDAEDGRRIRLGLKA